MLLSHCTNTNGRTQVKGENVMADGKMRELGLSEGSAAKQG